MNGNFNDDINNYYNSNTDIYTNSKTKKMITTIAAIKLMVAILIIKIKLIAV